MTAATSPRLSVKSVAVGSAVVAPTHDHELLIVPPEAKFRPSDWAWMMVADPAAGWAGVRYNSDLSCPANVIYLDCRESGHERDIKGLLAIARSVGLHCYAPPGFAERHPEVSRYLDALAAGASATIQ